MSVVGVRVNGHEPDPSDRHRLEYMQFILSTRRGIKTEIILHSHSHSVRTPSSGCRQSESECRHGLAVWLAGNVNGRAVSTWVRSGDQRLSQESRQRWRWCYQC